jgi:hypothetical protein
MKNFTLSVVWEKLINISDQFLARMTRHLSFQLSKIIICRPVIPMDPNWLFQTGSKETLFKSKIYIAILQWFRITLPFQIFFSVATRFSSGACTVYLKIFYKLHIGLKGLISNLCIVFTQNVYFVLFLIELFIDLSK